MTNTHPMITADFAEHYSSWHNGLRCDRCACDRNVYSSDAVIASNQGESLAWIIEAVNEHERVVHGG
jgi:hypothetical protein